MTRFTIALLTLCMLAGTAFAAPEAYVVNTNGETLTRITLFDGQVFPDIVTLGSDIQCAPNQLMVVDTIGLVVNSTTDEIQMIDLNAEKTIGFIPTGAGTNPFWLDIYDDRFLYVSLLLGNAVLKVDYKAGQAGQTIEVGKSPAGVAVSQGLVFVANSGFDFQTFEYDPGTVSVIDPVLDRVIAVIPVGLNPQSVVVDRNSRVHVICTGNYFDIPGAAYVIDPFQLGLIDSVLLGGTPGQASVGADNIVYTAAGGFSGPDGYLYAYDAVTLEPLHTVQNPLKVDSGCVGVTVYQDGTMFASSLSDHVTHIDGDGTVLNRFPVGDGPVHVDFNWTTGDVSGDFTITITDLTMLVNHLFVTFNPLPWPTWRANVNGDLALNLSDLTVLVNHLFVTFQPLESGPRWFNP